MELKLRELFGHDMEETGREGGEIDFSQFSDAFERSQLNTVRNICAFFSFDMYVDIVLTAYGLVSSTSLRSVYEVIRYHLFSCFYNPNNDSFLISFS